MKEYNKFKKSSCVNCSHNGSFYPLDIDHWATRKSHPEWKNEKFNCITLCRKCHQEKGRIGVKTFSFKYPKIKSWLIENGWVFNDFIQKWVRNE